MRRCDRPFADVIAVAVDLDWTRDPFDRMIVAQAAIGNTPLLTRDGVMREHYSEAFWED